LAFKDVLDVSSIVIKDKKTNNFPNDIKADELATLAFDDVSVETKSRWLLMNLVEDAESLLLHQFSNSPKIGP
jgi:hypothetical protein